MHDMAFIWYYSVYTKYMCV